MPSLFLQTDLPSPSKDTAYGLIFNGDNGNYWFYSDLQALTDKLEWYER
jgi:hypothetical protein